MSAQEVVKWLKANPGWHLTEEVAKGANVSVSACAANCRRAAYTWKEIEHKSTKKATAWGNRSANLWRGLP